MAFVSGSYEDWHQAIVELVLLKDRLGRIGMFKTMHALDHVTQAAGWEMAERFSPREREAWERQRKGGQ